MNWDAIGAAAELGGVILVLVTLVYLARQLKIIREQTTMTSLAESYAAQREISLQVATNADLAKLIEKANDSFDQLSASERRQYFHFLRATIGQFESWYLRRTLDPAPLSKQEVEKKARDFAADLWKRGGFSTFWDYAADEFADSFGQLVDSERHIT